MKKNNVKIVLVTAAVSLLLPLLSSCFYFEIDRNQTNLAKIRRGMTKEKVIEMKKGVKNVVVVVSAQGKTTDKLISEEAEISKNVSRREHDVLVSTGEQITIAKLCMALHTLNKKAISRRII